MADMTQWLIDWLFPDMAAVFTAIAILISIILVINSFRKWVN